MKHGKAMLGVLAALLLVSLTSCATTKFTMSPNLPSGQKKALLTGMYVGMENQNSNNGSPLGIAADILGNADLASFGMQAQKALTDYLATKGFNVFLDAAIAKRQDLPLDTGSKLALLGAWVNPKTSAYRPLYFTGLTIGFNKKEYLAKVKGNSNLQYFVYTSLLVSKENTFMMFGGYPMVRFHVAVVNDQGDVVLEARAYGKGKSQFIGVDTSKANLSLAFSNAITKLSELK